jgi:hypothetical protein
MKNYLKYIISFMIVTFISCNKIDEKVDENQIKNRTFLFYGNSEIEPFYIEFKDSTFYYIDNEGNEPKEMPWKFVDYDNSNFILFNNNVFGIKKDSIEKYILKNISTNEQSFKILEQKPKWKKSILYGEWFDKKYNSIDMENIPIPLPTLNTENNKKIWPPKFIIKKDTIYYEFLNFRSKSKYKISNSNNFILLKLETVISFNNNHFLWEIYEVNDSLLKIKSKKYDEYNTSGDYFEEEVIELRKNGR